MSFEARRRLVANHLQDAALVRDLRRSGPWEIFGAAMRESVQVATLKLALSLAGSLYELGRKVGLSSGSVARMLEGIEQIPGWVFLRAADYINEEQERQFRQPHTFDADRHEGSNTPQ